MKIVFALPSPLENPSSMDGISKPLTLCLQHSIHVWNRVVILQRRSIRVPEVEVKTKSYISILISHWNRVSNPI